MASVKGHTVARAKKTAQYLQERKSVSTAVKQAQVIPDTFWEWAQTLQIQIGEPFSIEGRAWLRDIVENDHNTTLILKTRQIGATTLFAALIIYYALKHPRTRHAYVTDTQEHMHMFSMDKLRPMLEATTS